MSVVLYPLLVLGAQLNQCCDLTLVGSSSHSAAYYPLRGVGERTRRVNMGKLLGGDRDSIVGKAKASHRGKTK